MISIFSKSRFTTLLGLAVVSLALLSGCSKADETDSSSSIISNLEVRDVIKRTADSGEATLLATYKNTSAVTAFDIACTIKANNGDQVVDTATANITSDLPNQTLSAGELAVLTATFNTLTSHDAYSNLQFEFTWKQERSETLIQSTQAISAADIED